MNRNSFLVVHRVQSLIIQNQIAIMDALDGIMFSMQRADQSNELSDERLHLNSIRTNARETADEISKYCNELAQFGYKNPYAPREVEQPEPPNAS